MEKVGLWPFECRCHMTNTELPLPDNIKNTLDCNVYIEVGSDSQTILRPFSQCTSRSLLFTPSVTAQKVLQAPMLTLNHFQIWSKYFRMGMLSLDPKTTFFNGNYFILYYVISILLITFAETHLTLCFISNNKIYLNISNIYSHKILLLVSDNLIAKLHRYFPQQLPVGA